MNRRRSVLAVLALVCLVLITVDSRGSAARGTEPGGGGTLAGLQRGAFALYAPIQDGFAGLVRPLGGFVSSIGQLGDLRQENAALRTENDRLRDIRASVADLERQNDELRELLNTQERLRLVTTAAQVIASPPSSFEWTVLIDVGAAQGVAEGMAVIDADGLVGRVIEVTPSRSRVLLAISPDAGFAVRIAQNGARGLITGQGSQPLRLELTEIDDPVPLDAELVTHRYTGTQIPDGVRVGLVQPPEGATSPQDLAGRRFLEVRPYVDFGHLGSVLVVLNTPAERDPLPEEQLIPNPLAPRPPAPETPIPDDAGGGADQAADDGAAAAPAPGTTGTGR